MRVAMEDMARELRAVLDLMLEWVAGGVPLHLARQRAELEASALIERARQRWTRGSRDGARVRAYTAAASASRDMLSAREIEVLALAGQGLSGEEIADMLSLSRHTVYKHLENACGKLGVRGTRGALAEARVRGLIG